MENITIDNKNCIFLNHHKLIENLYQQYVDPKAVSYQMKPEIFDFKPKSSQNSLPPKVNSNSKPAKTHRRKRKAETENESVMKEIQHLQPFIMEIQQKCLIFSQINEVLPRFWEEENHFPQFRGGNATNEFQITKFSKHDYIIPPKTKFFNYNIESLSKLLPELETYDLLVMDMPWHNKYIRRLKKVKTSLAYQMLDNETLKSMPVPKLLHKTSFVVIWCTNALQHRKAIEEEFLPAWNLQLVHSLKWYKINTHGELISPPKPEGCKQPYEMLYIACSKQRILSDLKELTKVDFLISIPSIIHSHKPPVADLFKQYLPNAENFKGLEIFARYLQPQFTSIGLEVLKLMDKRLYNVS